MSALPARIGASSFGMSPALYWLSASVLTIRSAPSLRQASRPAWKPAASPLLFVSRTMWSTPCARATSTVRSVEPSSMTSHSTVSKPSTARGRSARVAGSVASSSRQGIWMMSFMPGVAPVSHMVRPAPLRAVRGQGWRIALTAVLAAALGLRLWGVKHGLPYVYNVDENAHFVPNAIGLFGHGWNPHYFVNPPAYTYLLHVVFDVWFGGRKGVYDAYTVNPGEVFVVARLTAAAVGTVAVWLLYLAGAKLFGRAVGLLAAALLAVSFLAVFYSHLALNDVPTLAPIALSLWGTAGVLRDGRLRWYLLAGAGVGFACATKYTGGVVLVPLLGA